MNFQNEDAPKKVMLKSTCMYQAAHGVSRTLFPTKNMVHGLAHLNLDITIFCRKLLEGDVKHSLEMLKTAQLGFRQVA